MDDFGQILQDFEDYGYAVIDCPSCGEGHELEMDGHCVCDCGKTVKSPLLVLGMI